ncbi:unnamed protein product [Rotaria socialis]|uniref:Uncharacterized protein n=1 Tax=Rotaria socialis TaxID=392032 RepID=A0A817WHK2_9BILA|nr:unnamed protein product [Rotaria socialis]CAF3559718.1 unnamed protein product [Rotaria socialis]CAF3595194.1 unnamed protein product [Rotaria socialis]CAF3627104.1 unnamed protein product [Rotaria socialis]CAF3696252.1 unnamed protein product [Rotaria socialis]
MLAAIRYRVSQSVNILQATIVRLGFCTHNLIATYFLYDDIKDYWCLLNLSGTIFLIIELAVTIIERQGLEPKWFSPSFLIFILTSMPSLWLLEVRRVAQRRLAFSTNDNESNTESFDQFIFRMGTDEIVPSQALPHNILTKTLRINVNSETKIMGLELSLLLLIIIGRWLLPKGATSRSNLSQLLLVYMSIASDIVDLLTIFNEHQVLSSQRMLVAILVVLSWSLLQFATNMTAANKNARSTALDNFRFSIKKRQRSRMLFLYLMQRLFENDAWDLHELNLMSCSAVQLALRLVAVIKFEVRSYSILFFTCKNSIILFLQVYRVVAIITENNNNDLGPIYETTFNNDQQQSRTGTSSIKTKNECGSRFSIEEDM